MHATPDPTAYLTEVLSTRPGEVQVLEVRTASLEDAYLDLVRLTQTPDTPTSEDVAPP